MAPFEYFFPILLILYSFKIPKPFICFVLEEKFVKIRLSNGLKFVCARSILIYVQKVLVQGPTHFGFIISIISSQFELVARHVQLFLVRL